MSDPDPRPISFAARFRSLARTHGQQAAITFEGRTITYSQLDERSEQLAQHLVTLGVGTDQYVTIAEPNSFEFLVTCVASWKLGATPQPVSARLPRAELDAIIELANPTVVVGVEAAGRSWLPQGFNPPAAAANAPPLGDAVAAAWKAPTSGGSTGRPKLIVSGDGSAYTGGLSGLASVIGARSGETMVMPGPLYHNGPFLWSALTLLAGGHLVLLRRFDAEATLAAVQEHRATAMYMVPTMMQRIWKLPETTRLAYDMSSLEIMFHLAEPCPPWLKEAWIDWIGPSPIWELYGGTEGQCFTVLDGNEWLEHRGSVGKPVSGECKICDSDGVELAAEEVGDVWLRSTGRDTPTYFYVGAEPDERDGWESLGDVGWMDADGYLYLADRRTDMILVGGANVYPAEVEAAIGAHPQVQSCAVIGLPDEDKGSAVHAIVQGDSIDTTELMGFLAERLVSYKLPRTVEFVDEALRDDAGKVRRTALREARL